MINCLIITYDDMSVTLLKRAELLTGEKTQIKALAIHPDMTQEHIRTIILKEISNNNTKETLILTDIFGSPHMKSILSLPGCFKVISGVNLPMVISVKKALLKGETDLNNLVSIVLSETQESIMEKTLQHLHVTKEI